MAESAVLAKSLQILGNEGAWFVKMHGSVFGRAGIPDVLFCLQSRFGAIETKTEQGRVSRLQLYVLAKIREAGGYAVVVRTENDLLELLAEMKNDVA